MTIHHWTDQAKGLAEMRRVTRRPIVILAYDPALVALVDACEQLQVDWRAVTSVV